MEAASRLRALNSAIVAQRFGAVLTLAVPLVTAAQAAPPVVNAASPTSAPTLYAAQTPPVPLEDSGAGVPNGAAPNSAREPAAPTSAAPGIPPNPYADYRWKGININLPPPPNTIDLNLGGLRQTLADRYGIGYFGLSQSTFYDNVLHHQNNIRGQQVYVGQKPTENTTNFLGVTLDLRRYGIPDGQIVVVGSEQTVSWEPLGPKSLNVGTLSYYQTLFNKRLEIKAGLLANAFEFIGPFVAGSLNGGVFGPQGQIAAEAGLAGLQYPQAGINITGHLTEHLYDKLGIERAINPDGTVLEHIYNRTGLTKFQTPNTGALFINEFGYLRPAAPGSPQTWVRADGMVNNSWYVELDHPQRRGNKDYALLLLADRQLLQTSSAPGEAYRGLYTGFSVEYTPPNFNRFSQYYEARLYGLGLIPGRPRDQVSLLFTDTVFSDIAYRAARAARQPAHPDSKAITLSYSAQVIHGIFLNGAVQYVNNPSPIVYTTSTGSALNLIVGTSVFF